MAEPSNNDRGSAGEMWPCLQAPGTEEEGSEENRAGSRPHPAGQQGRPQACQLPQLHVVERMTSKAFLYLVSAIPKCFPPSML